MSIIVPVQNVPVTCTVRRMVRKLGSCSTTYDVCSCTAVGSTCSSSYRSGSSRVILSSVYTRHGRGQGMARGSQASSLLVTWFRFLKNETHFFLFCFVFSSKVQSYVKFLRCYFWTLKIAGSNSFWYMYMYIHYIVCAPGKWSNWPALENLPASAIIGVIM